MSTRPRVEAARAGWAKALAALPKLRRYGIIVSLLILFACFSVLRPAIFPTLGNLISILKQISLLGILSAGLTSAWF